MKYLIYTLILFSILIWSFFKRNIRKKAIKILLFKKLEEKTYAGHNLTLFLSYIVETISDLILKLPYKNQKKILNNLWKNHYDELLKQVKKKDLFLAVLLEALLAEKNMNALCLKKKECSSLSSKLILGLYYESTFQFDELNKLVQNLPSFYLKRKNRAVYRLLKARTFFHQTDMAKSSKLLLKCAKNFKKLKLSDELAYSYFLMSEIYRICGVYDAAEILITEARQIYKNADHDFGQTFALAERGLILLNNNRLDEALNCFTEAKKVYHQNKDFVHEAEMMGQEAFLYNLKKESKKALSLAKKALKIHQKYKNKIGISFCYEQISGAYYGLCDFKKALNYALYATDSYFKQKNHSAYMEMLQFLTELHLLFNNNKKAVQTFKKLKNYHRKHQKFFDKKQIENLSQKLKN